MDQRPPPCAYQAPRPLVPPMTTPTDSTALYTAPWPHHPDVAYRPLLPGTVAVPTSDHGQTSTAGCSSSPYSELPTLSQIGFTPPGNVARWWVREGMGPHGYAPYFSYTYTGPMPCGSDSETQDDRFPLPQTGEMQMSAVGLGQMPAQAATQGQIMGLRQRLASVASQGLERAKCLYLGRARGRYLERARYHFPVRVRCQIWGGARFSMRGTLRCWVPISWPPIAPRICFQMMISSLHQREGLARRSQATRRPSKYRLTRFG